jgi:PAS domain S-box-containing protein
MKEGATIFSNWIKGFLVLAIVALLSTGAWFYHDQEQNIRKRVEEDLSAVARLKADQIAAWRKDQLADAAFLQLHPFLSRSVARFLADTSEENKRDLQVRFQSVADQHDYADMLLVAPDGEPLLSLIEPVGGHHGYQLALAEALRDRKPVLTGLHMARPGAFPHISAVVPLYEAIGPGTEPFAALVLINDASRFLYPLIQFWPTPSETAETLLVEQDGDEVLFLNDLRHQPDTALKLRIPLSRTDVPAVMAVLGRQGFFQGMDYRGVEVVSVILHVPDSPWFMIAKIDSAEAFAEWRFRSVLLLGLLFGLTVSMLTSGLVLWQRDKKAQYRALYLSEAELRANVERHSITLRSIGDAVISTDARGMVELLNPPAEFLTGWKQDEARGRPLKEVFRIISEETREPSEDPVAKVMREGIVVGLANHTILVSREGTERPIADSGAPIRAETGEIIGAVLVFRDQSIERAAREALRKSEARYRQVLDGMLEGCQIIDPDWRYVYVNAAAARQGRKERDELLGRTMTEVYPGIETTNLFAVLQSAMKDRHPRRLENEFNYPDGDRGYFDLSIEPVPEGLFILSIDITERRLAERELQQSTERQRFLADIVENTQQALAVGYPDGRIGFFNRAFCELTGYDREDLQATDWSETLTPLEWRKSEAEALAETARDGNPVRYEKEYLRKDGTRVPIELLVHAIKNTAGDIQYYYAFVTDITQRKKAEEELKLSHKNFYRAFSSSPAALAITRSEDGKFIIINDSYSRIMGYQAEEIVGRTVDDLNIYINQNERSQLLQELRDKGTVRDYELSVRSKTGRFLHLLVSMEPTIYNYEEAIISTFIDITKLKEAGLRIEHLNSVLRALRNVNQLITDEKDRDRLLRRACEILTETRGYRSAWIGIRTPDGGLFAAAESGIGDGFSAVRAELERGEWPECCRYAMDTNGVVVVRDTAINCNGCPLSHNYRSTSALSGFLRHAERDYGVLVASLPVNMAEDIEEQSLFTEIIGDIAFALFSIENDREREKLEAQLRQSQKMEAVGRLAGGVAHDFNNMLSIIFGHAEMAMEMTDEADPLQAELRDIMNAARRSADLTRQLLAFARKQTIAPRVLELNAIVESLLKMLGRIIGEDIDIVWSPGRDLWPIRMDPSQVDQILANLCVNARDAITDVGKVTIETSNKKFDEAYCADHRGFLSGDYVMLAVSDDGCGMDRDTLDKIFEPFFTTKGQGRGTGLGLATVYGTVKQNDGFVNVYSEPGRGSTFRIYLPRYTGSAGIEPLEEVKTQITGGGETILLVEDEQALLQLGQRMLESLGYKVLATTAPGEAIRLAGEYAGKIHLVITDVIMPEMNGRDLAGKLIPLQPGAGFLFMSGYTANVIAHHGVLDKDVHFIQKPFSKQDIAAKIRIALDHREKEIPNDGKRMVSRSAGEKV